MAEPYSPLRYPGGKARLADFLIEVMKYNGLNMPHYVEPYAGGAGAALRLLFEEFVETIAINDADPRIRCFWQAITKQNDAFLRLLDESVVTVEEWRRQREIYKKRDLRKVLELGFSTFFLNRTARSGIIHNGGPIGGYDQNGNYKIDARYNRAQLARRIHRIGAYADRIEVTGDDGLTLLKKLNRYRTRAKKTFVYLDPPYYAKSADLYLNRFTNEQHTNLATYFRSRKNFPWVMTYDNVSEIRDLYSEFLQVCFNLSYSVYKRRQGQELLIYPRSLHVPQCAERTLPSVA